MEDSQSARSDKSGKPTLQRYALRSATKSKDEKPLSNSTSSRRGRIASSVSNSVNILDLSGKDKSAAKPPRRLSVPTKSAVSPAPRLVGNITPISEARMKRSGSIKGKSDTPVSDVSRSASRKKFSVLSSASYWLSQIKLSEAVAKHSISLGFFKLALEAGCEPLQRLRDDLKSYARRYDLGEFGELVKELFESYNITENTEQLQVSESFSQAPEEGTRSSDDDVRSLSSTGSVRKLKPNPSNNDTPQVSKVTGSTKKVCTTQGPNPPAKAKRSLTKSSANSRSFSETGTRNNSLSKPQKPIKQESKKGKDMVKKQGKKSAGEEGPDSSSHAEKTLKENKENMAASSRAIPLTEVE